MAHAIRYNANEMIPQRIVFSIIFDIAFTLGGWKIMEIRQILAENVSKLRKKSGISQLQFSLNADITTGMLSDMEHGRGKFGAYHACQSSRSAGCPSL